MHNYKTSVNHMQYTCMRIVALAINTRSTRTLQLSCGCVGSISTTPVSMDAMGSASVPWADVPHTKPDIRPFFDFTKSTDFSMMTINHKIQNE